MFSEFIDVCTHAVTLTNRIKVRWNVKPQLIDEIMFLVLTYTTQKKNVVYIDNRSDRYWFKTHVTENPVWQLDKMFSTNC